jgi:drug/metabolite transporter (DMT)-like permease
MNEKKLYILMVLAAFFWAGAFIAGKLSVPYIPPYSLSFLRFIFAIIVMMFLLKQRKEKFVVEKRHIPIFLFTGLVGMFGYHVLFFSALQYTTAINSSILAAMNPIVTALIGFLFAKQKISKQMLLGIIISFIGVLLTITSGRLSVLKELQFNHGDILMFMAVISWAAYGVFSKSKGQGIPPIMLTFYSFVVCDIALIPFVIYEKPWQWLPAVPVSAYMAVLYMSIFASVIGYLVQQISIREIGPARTAIFINLVPIFSIILAVLVLHEKLEVIKLFTALIIIAGVFLCQMEGLRASRNAEKNISA